MSQASCFLNDDEEEAVEMLKSFFGTASRPGAVQSMLRLMQILIPCAKKIGDEKILTAHDQNTKEDLVIQIV